MGSKYVRGDNIRGKEGNIVRIFFTLKRNETLEPTKCKT